jgi:hypothetical protein
LAHVEPADAELSDLLHLTGIDLSALPPVMNTEQLAGVLGTTPGALARIVGSPSETAVACHKLLNAQLTYGFAEANNPAISPLLQADSRPRCADAVTQFRITQKMPVTR